MNDARRASAAPASGEPAASVFQRAANFLFGYDFFISYAWADGRRYAVALANQLGAQGFRCFLDSTDFAKGENWRRAGGRALGKTSRLLLLVSPAALRSDPVRHEIELFKKSGRMILPIDFGATLHRADSGAALHALLPKDILRIAEPATGLETGPSEQTLREIRESFNLLRQDQRRIRWLTGAAALFALIAILAVAAGAMAEIRRREALSRGLAAQAAVESERQIDLALLLAAEAHGVRSTSQSASSLLRTLHLTRVEGFLHCEAVPGSLAAHPLRPEIVAVGMWNGAVEIWDVTRRVRLAKREAGEGGVSALSFSGDGIRLCAGGRNHRLLIWEMANDGALREVANAPHPAAKTINAVHFLDDGSVIVGGDEGTLRRYRPAENSWMELPAEHTASVSVIRRDATGGRLLTAGSNGDIVRWDLSDPTFSRRTTLPGDDWVLCLAPSADGKWIAAGTHDKAVELWDLAQGKKVMRLPALKAAERIFAVGFAPDGRSLSWGGDDGAINTFDFEAAAVRQAFPHSDALLAFTWTGDGTRLVTAGRDRKISIWNLARLSPLAREVVRFTSDGGFITASAHSEADHTLLGDERGNLLLLDRRAGRLAPPHPAHEGRVLGALALGKADAEFVSTGADKKVRWWRVEDGRLAEAAVVSAPAPLRHLPRVMDDGAILGVTAEGGVYRCQRGEAAAQWLGMCFDRPPAEQPSAVFAAHPTRPVIAAASGVHLTFFDYRRGTRLVAPQAGDYIRRMQFSPEGDELLCAVGARLEMRDATTGGERAAMQTGRMSPVDWAVSGQGMLLCAENDAGLTWWDLSARMQLGATMKLPAIDIGAVQFSSVENAWLTLERTYAEGRNHYVLRAWDADPAGWSQHARVIANRPLSKLEAARFGR